LGSPRRYFLWETFEIESVRRTRSGAFQADGRGWQLAPPPELKGKEFDRLRMACANFVGFRRVTELDFSRTLLALANARRRPAKPRDTVRFLKSVLNLLPNDGADRETAVRLLARLEPMRALSIRQPHAEAIMRGVKPVEYRSGPTHVRGRVMIYASLGRYSRMEEAEMMAGYRIRDVACDDLPRGVIVGIVDLYDCDDGDWYVRNPERASQLVRPRNQPQPVWFNPF
jgi:hypothetical protein